MTVTRKRIDQIVEAQSDAWRADTVASLGERLVVTERRIGTAATNVRKALGEIELAVEAVTDSDYPQEAAQSVGAEALRLVALTAERAALVEELGRMGFGVDLLRS
jgi:hypothetical protein